MRNLLINTSVDDMRSSLNCSLSLYNTREQKEAFIINLEENIKAEKEKRNRSSVISLFESKIKFLRKSL
jgi:hypothetical protein